jgi:hypothetical protein
MSSVIEVDGTPLVCEEGVVEFADYRREFDGFP